MMLLQSDKIKLQQTQASDLPFVIEAENATENIPFVSQWTYEQHLESLSDDNIAHLLIVNRDGKQVGYVIVTGLLQSNQAIYIKRIVVQEKNQGYGKETLRLIMKWVFEETDTHRLWLDVLESNKKARNIYESVGFTFEGTLRDCAIKDNKFISLSVMSILRHEYEKAKKS